VLAALLAWEARDRGTLAWVAITAGLVAGLLAIASAASYLQRPHLARRLGTVYSGVGLLYGIAVTALSGIGVPVVFTLACPIANGVLLHTVFRRELSDP
jgi:hypothetical protein